MNSIQVSPLAESASATESAELNPRPRILVVEDDPDIRRLNAEVLASSGYAVDAAEDGAVAWEALQANHYDLVVTDYRMPRVTGGELIQKIYAAQIPVPVIVVSGETHDLESFCQPAGVLLKPYGFHELLEIVKEVLGVGPAASATIAASPPSWPGQLARQNRLHKSMGW
jgi:DNA-binding response OmpR family regulator